MKKIISYISHTTLIIAVIIGGYAFIDIYLLKSKLPPGVCPITTNRPLLYIAIALCCVSFISSFFESKEKE
ncbi:MAG: hypothetical protein AB7G87_08300 [Clostridia bacterium]